MTSEDIRDAIYGAMAYAQGNGRLEVIEDFEREGKRTIKLYLFDGQTVTITVPNLTS